MQQGKQIENTLVKVTRIAGVFYSLRLKDAQLLFSFHVSSLIQMRTICITLTHINAYNRSVQTNILKTYSFGYPTLIGALTLCVEHGLLKIVPDRRKTNINKLVAMNTFAITPLGRQTVDKINDLLLFRIELMRK